MTFKIQELGWDVAWQVGSFPGIQKSLGLTPAPHKPSMLVHAQGLSTEEVKAEDSEIQGHAWLYPRLKLLWHRRTSHKGDGGS